jgi:hypothetical protein
MTIFAVVLLDGIRQRRRGVLSAVRGGDLVCLGAEVEAAAGREDAISSVRTLSVGGAEGDVVRFVFGIDFSTAVLDTSVPFAAGTTRGSLADPLALTGRRLLRSPVYEMDADEPARRLSSTSPSSGSLYDNTLPPMPPTGGAPPSHPSDPSDLSNKVHLPGFVFADSRTPDFSAIPEFEFGDAGDDTVHATAGYLDDDHFLDIVQANGRGRTKIFFGTAYSERTGDFGHVEATELDDAGSDTRRVAVIVLPLPTHSGSHSGSRSVSYPL